MEFYLCAVGEKGRNGIFIFFKYAEMIYPLEFTFAVPPSYLHTTALGCEPHTSSEWMVPYGKEVKALSKNV